MTRKPLLDGTDRGVSDVIAFTIVFGIIITSVGIVSVVGFQSLQDIQENEQGLNAQRAFQTVADNLAELQSGQTPARTSELEPRGGTIEVGSGPQVRVVVRDDSSGNLLNETVVSDIGSLTYSLRGLDRTIGIQSGAVFNAEDTGTVMVKPPKFVCRKPSSGDNVAIVSILALQTGGGEARGGSGSDIQIRATRTPASRLAYSNSTDGSNERNVEVEVTGSRFGAALSEGIGQEWSGSYSSPTATLECNGVDDVVVRVTVIDVELR